MPTQNNQTFHGLLFLFLFLFLIPLSSIAQDEGQSMWHYKHDISSNDNGSIKNYGFEFEYFVLDNLSINYSLSFGHYDDPNENKFLIHTPAGFIAGPQLFLRGLFSCAGCLKEDGYYEYEEHFESNEWHTDSIWVDTRRPEKTIRCDKAGKRILMGLLITALPEGINYQFPIIRNNLRFGPYINFAGLDFIHDKDTKETNAVWAYGAGAKVIISDGDNFFNLTGYAEMRGNVWEPFHAYYGLKLGFSFD
ncbi:MAG: hypothetical protein ACI9J3_002479 [Parvicellaceae bacterium]|jgi:hypothetical protein